MPDPIRVLLIEDNPEYREAVRLALEDLPDILLIGEFGTSEVALRTLAEDSPTDAPDIILLDLRLPGQSGLDALTDLCRCALQAKIIVLTQSNREQDVLRAISLGAAGYLLKSATLSQIIDGIRTVAEGGATLDADVARFILSSLQARLPEGSDKARLLSERELEILALLADGLVKKQIAGRLNISYTTVDTHVGRIYSKLKVTNAASAIDKAHRLSILSLSDKSTR